MKYVLVLALLMMPGVVVAGDGHDHGESAFSGNNQYLDSFELSEKTIKNLDIKTAIAGKQSLQESMLLPCIIKNPQEQSALISVNYMSRVEKIHVTVGDKVTKGQTLFTVFSYVAVRDMEIKSPIDGVVSLQSVKIGQIVQQDMNLAEISTMKYFYAEGMAYLSDDISHIKVGDKARIMIEGTHEDALGHVKGFSPIVNSENKTKTVIVYFESKDEHVFPNMHCQMNVYMGKAREAIAVPKKAVLGDFGHYFVFLKHDNHFDREEVVKGFENGNLVEITDGLHEGDEVVVQGNYQLQFVDAATVGKVVNHEEHDHD